MKILTTFILSCFFIKLPAQSFNPDSLVNLVITSQTEDHKIDAAIELFDQYEIGNLDSLMIYSIRIMELGQKYKFRSIEVLGYCEMGYAFYRLDNSSKAVDITFKALKMAESLDNKRIIANIYNCLGALYIGNEKAIEFHKKGLASSTEQKAHKERAWLLTNLSNEFHRRKQFDSALVYALEANKLVLKNQYKKGFSSALYNAGRAYMSLDQNELSLTYFRLSLADARKNNSLYLERRASFGLGALFEKVGNMDSAFYYTKKSLDLAMLESSTAKLAPARWIYQFYNDKGNSDSALKYLLVYTNAKDSAQSKEEIQKLQSLGFEEELRQKELAVEKKNAAEERSHNLQYAAIAVGLITFVILFLVLSRSIIVKQKFIEFFTILGLLAVFEFINLFIHPYLANITNNSPVLMLIVLIAIGALLIPLHHKLQKWITNIMVEKNKNIRLAAAKKTIANLEGDPTN